MSYDDKTGRMDWKDEFSWMSISLTSGVALSFLFIFFNKFQNAGYFVVFFLSSISLYVLSILLRIQNHRGKILTSRTAVNEKYIKYIFPIIGLGIGLALICL
jgi:hypothetical protein